MALERPPGINWGLPMALSASIFLEGGHSVADPIIEQRYQMGLSYLKSKVLEFSEATIVDVSGHQPRVMAQLRRGEVLYKATSCPYWIEATLSLAEKIQLRKK